MRGVLLIADGHPYYTHNAYNNALSIRAHSDIPICLAHRGDGFSYLLEDQKKIFTHFFDIPDSFVFEKGNWEPYKAKVFMNELTPFEETLFLDADMIFSPYKKVEDLFKELEGLSLQFGCHGEKQMDQTLESEWVDLGEVKEKYGFNHWYDLSSEVVYFKKSETKDFFLAAQQFYSTHGLKLKEIERNGVMQRMFKMGTPDELPFALALEKLGLKINAPYFPSYWQPRFFKKMQPDEVILNNYYLLSAGGAQLYPNVKRIYDRLIKHYYSVMKIKRTPYEGKNKNSLMKERNII